MTTADRLGLATVGIALVLVVGFVIYQATDRHAATPTRSHEHSPTDGHNHPSDRQPPIVLAAGLPPLPESTAPLARPQEMMAEAYQLAAEHPEVLQKLPCFCGCMKRGHRSNHDCFVASRDGAGSVTWNAHGLTCGMCVDIARDAKRMLALGKNVDEIRRTIDGAYGKGAQ